MTKQRRPLTVCIALAAFLIAAFFSLRFGSSSMSWKAFLGGLLQKEGYETETIILCSLRLPRMLAAPEAPADDRAGRGGRPLKGVNEYYVPCLLPPEAARLARERRLIAVRPLELTPRGLRTALVEDAG